MNGAHLGPFIVQHGPVKIPLALAAVLLVTACGTQHAGQEAVTAPTVGPDLAGHQDDIPHAEHVLVAGDSQDLTLPAGRLRVTVWGPKLVEVPTLVKTKGYQRHSYLATFTIVAKTLSGTATLRPADFRLLAIADQVDGGAIRTLTATATEALTQGFTWTAPFVEGHGELLFTPVGAARPAVLWDFRAES